MKLYKISRLDKTDYDDYDSAIVAATDPDDAAIIHPNGYAPDYPNPDWSEAYTSWVNRPSLVKVEHLGEAAPNIVRGVILASFNAG